MLDYEPLALQCALLSAEASGLTSVQDHRRHQQSCPPAAAPTGQFRAPAAGQAGHKPRHDGSAGQLQPSSSEAPEGSSPQVSLLKPLCASTCSSPCRALPAFDCRNSNQQQSRSNATPGPLTTMCRSCFSPLRYSHQRKLKLSIRLGGHSLKLNVRPMLQQVVQRQLKTKLPRQSASEAWLPCCFACYEPP